MTIILEKDPDLLSRYEQEDKKGIPETMFAYLDEYNAKYWMEGSVTGLFSAD